MSTTTVISKYSRLRRSLHRLNHRTFFTSPPSPSPTLPHSTAAAATTTTTSSLFRPFLTFLNSASLRGEIESFRLYDRYLYTSAAALPSSGGGSSPPSSGGGKSPPSPPSSGDAGKAEGSKQAGDAGNSEGSKQAGDAGNSEGSKQSGDAGNSEGSKQSGDAGKSVRGSPVSWMSFVLLLVTGAGLVFYYDREKKRHIEGINVASSAVRQGPSVGQAAIGGPFKLVNHDGINVTEKDFLGKWTVMYFGFTHCPDICPDELQKLAAAVDKIKEKSGIEIVPVFISVDPERDNVEQVSEYVKEFHPKLIGLTGDPEEIRKVARAYRVYYMKTTEEGSDYLVDHSIVMYLMSPRMEFVKFYGKNNDVDGLVDGIIKEVKNHKK